MFSSTQKSAAILCLHGHGRFGKDSIVGLKHTPERTDEVERLQYDFRTPLLRKQGYVVLAPDLRGFGERQPHYPDPKPDYCCRNYMAATLLGRTVVGYQTLATFTRPWTCCSPCLMSILKCSLPRASPTADA